MHEPVPRSAFPSWIFLGGLILALGYFPTLNAPFDFIDDGNLVYPGPEGLSLSGHVSQWWDKVRANVEHLGPFRPVLWVHWELAANLLHGDPVAWRAVRLVWCALAAMTLLWLFRELKLTPTAALLAGAAAMWNPYRNEIWTSLTLAEGVAMPYALLALVASRKATSSPRPALWDLLAVFGLLAALGCKNTFVALVPAMMTLRMLPEGMTIREGWRANRFRAALYLLPLILPAAHFVYFKLNWHPGQYETPGPSLAQLGRMGSWLKGAAGLDFLGVGIALLLVGLAWTTSRATIREYAQEYRAGLIAAGILFLAGVAVYLPLPMMAARYTMPAIWGVDIALAISFTVALTRLNLWPQRVAFAAIAIGLGVMMMANVGRQEKVAARARMLWDAIHHVEATAPPGAGIAWVSGENGALNVEEGIHFHWHLLHRGRGDVRVGLVDEAGVPITRVELPPLTGEPMYRLAVSPGGQGWSDERSFAAGYWMGRKRYSCRLEAARAPATGGLDPWTMALMKMQFQEPGTEGELLKKLSGPDASGQRPSAGLKSPLP